MRLPNLDDAGPSDHVRVFCTAKVKYDEDVQDIDSVQCLHE